MCLYSELLKPRLGALCLAFGSLQSQEARQHGRALPQLCQQCLANLVVMSWKDGDPTQD